MVGMAETIRPARWRKSMQYVLPIAAITLFMASLTVAAADQQSTDCAKYAQRYQAALAKHKAGTVQYSQAEYWAMEGQSYCETGHADEGVAAYQRALQALGH
jgi:hypothetical protein